MYQNRVDLVLTQLEPGGAQKAAINLANGLAERGYTVKIVFFYSLRESEFDIDSRVEVVVLLDKATWLRKVLLTPYRLIALWRSERPSCVVSFTHYANIYSSIASKLLNIPIVVSHRNPRYTYSRIIKAVDLILCKLRFYDYITFVSNETKDSFHVYGRKLKNSKVIYNCSDITDVSHVEKPNNKAGKRKIIIAIGRLFEQKNHELLIKALAASKSDIELRIIGSGPLENKLKQLASDLNVKKQVIFLGNLSHSNVIEQLDTADYFAMPSKYEGMSNALLEAIYVGLHTIVSDVPAQVEVVSVENEIYGTILPSGNVKAWADYFKNIEEIDSNKLCGSSIQKKLIDRYSYSRFVDQFESVINSVLAPS